MTKPLANTLCPLCGGANQCMPATTGSFEGECWCTRAVISADALAKVPKQLIDRACLCPRCAGTEQAKPQILDPQP